MRNIVYTLISFSFLVSCVSESADPQDTYDVLYVSRDGAQMPAHIHGNVGSNTFIVLLHGGPGGTGLGYRIGNYHRRLEERFAVVYFDQRAQGMSQGNFNSSSVTVDNMVDDVKLLTDVLQHKYGEDISLFLMGHSWGGTLGTAFMSNTEYQSEYNGWIEVDGAHDFNLMFQSQKPMFESIGEAQIAEQNDVMFWTDALEEIGMIDFNDIQDEDIGTLNRLAFESEANLQANSDLIASSDLEGEDAWRIIESNFTINNQVVTSVTGGVTNSTLFDKGLWRRDYTGGMPDITIPTMLAWGRYDFVVPPTLAQQAFDLIGAEEKELWIFESSGHSPMLTEGDLFAERVINFVDLYR